MCKYGESKMTRIMMATVPHITSGSGLRKFLQGGRCYIQLLHNRFYMYFDTQFLCNVICIQHVRELLLYIRDVLSCVREVLACKTGTVMCKRGSVICKKYLDNLISWMS